MKQSRVMRGLGLLVLAAMTVLPLAAGAADLSAEEGQGIAGRYGRGAGGYGPGDGTGDGVPDYDCDGYGPGLGDCACINS